MKDQIGLVGYVKEGRLELYDLPNLDQFEGQFLTITIARKKKHRSHRSNAYYWGVIIPSVQQGLKELGERLTLDDTESWLINYLLTSTPDHVHSFLKDRFISSEKPSTARMNNSEFSDYLAAVIQFANEVLNIEVPEPNQLNN